MNSFTSQRRYSRGVFTGHGPGLKLNNLESLTMSAAIDAIDFHVSTDPTAAEAELKTLPRLLDKLGIKVEAIVFGLPDEKWNTPKIARENVGFAATAITSLQRAERFRYARDLALAVCEHLDPSHFARNQVTMKGHFGAFDSKRNSDIYNYLTTALTVLRTQTLEPNNILFLAETGCEPDMAVVELIQAIGAKSYGANWDSANLKMWGTLFDNIEYGRTLARAGVLRGIHLKHAIPSGDENWGSEIDPDEQLITSVLSVADDATCFDGPIIVEREIAFGGQSEDQSQKAQGLLRTLKLLNDKMPSK